MAGLSIHKLKNSSVIFSITILVIILMASIPQLLEREDDIKYSDKPIIRNEEEILLK